MRFQVRPRHQLLFQEKPVRWFRHFHQLISHFHLTLNLPSLTEESALLQPLHFQTDLEIPSVNFVFSNPLKIVRSSKFFTKLTNSLILHYIKYSYLLRLTLALLWPSSTSLYRFRLFNVRWTAILEVSIPISKVEIDHDFPDRALVVFLLFDYKFSHFDGQAISLGFIRHDAGKIKV